MLLLPEGSRLTRDDSIFADPIKLPIHLFLENTQIKWMVFQSLVQHLAWQYCLTKVETI